MLAGRARDVLRVASSPRQSARSRSRDSSVRLASSTASPSCTPRPVRRSGPGGRRDQAVDEHPLGHVPRRRSLPAGPASAARAGALVDLVPVNHRRRWPCRGCRRVRPSPAGARGAPRAASSRDRRPRRASRRPRGRPANRRSSARRCRGPRRRAGAVAPRLEAAQREQLLGSVADVGALCGGHPVGYPPQSAQVPSRDRA